jgi:DNA-binding GntR family transcriptional regulator
MKTRAPQRPNAAPATFRTKEEYVADFLREGILSGDIPRGTRLKQAELAEQLELSITPVREALKLLAAEGYVHGATHRGAIVLPFDVAAAAEIVELRALLETRLTVSAMQRMTLREMQQTQLLAQDFEQAIESGDSNTTRSANYHFHRFLFGLAVEPLTLRFVQVLWAKYPFDIISRLPGRTGRAAKEHARIIDAVVSRNAEAAANATREHIRAGWGELQAAIAANPELGREAMPSARSDSA